MKSPPAGESRTPVEIDYENDERARMKLYKRESLWKTHIARGEVAIIDMDMNGFITYWSPKAEKIYGWDEVEIQNKHVSILYSTCDVAHGKAAFELRATEHKGAFSAFAWQKRKNAQQFWSYLESQVISDENGQAIGIRKLLIELDLAGGLRNIGNMVQHKKTSDEHSSAKAVRPLLIDPPVGQSSRATCRHQLRGYQY